MVKISTNGWINPAHIISIEFQTDISDHIHSYALKLVFVSEDRVRLLYKTKLAALKALNILTNYTQGRPKSVTRKALGDK